MKKYFRQHRGSFLESMRTAMEVSGLADIRKFYESDTYIKNDSIKIGDEVKDERCVPFGWGDTSYYLLADFGGYTEQCIGMTNFKE